MTITRLSTRKLVFMALFLLPVTLIAQQQQPLLMPPFLKPGDRIAIISPCSQPEEKTVLEGCAILQQWGYEPVVAPHALSNYHGFAGTTEERVADLRWALRDTTIHAIMCSRGGDGAPHLLPYIDAADYRQHPKWLIGFSDITALHSASVNAGVMSIHGSMCHAIAAQQGVDSVSITLRNMLQGVLPSYQIAPHDLNQMGTAEGILVGGNLSVLCGLAASPYDCLSSDRSDLVLFIEDTKEDMTKVDRMLHQLMLRGVLQRLKGIIVGHFTKYKHPENDFDDMNAMLHEYLQHLSIPVCYGFPVGHQRPNLPLIEGCRVRFSVTEHGTTLVFLKDTSTITDAGRAADR